jgi:hypothetical protein
LWNAAIANGWKIQHREPADVPFAEAAVAPIGPYYRPAFADPLFRHVSPAVLARERADEGFLFFSMA